MNRTTKRSLLAAALGFVLACISFRENFAAFLRWHQWERYWISLAFAVAGILALGLAFGALSLSRRFVSWLFAGTMLGIYACMWMSEGNGTDEASMSACIDSTVDDFYCQGFFGYPSLIGWGVVLGTGAGIVSKVLRTILAARSRD